MGVEMWVGDPLVGNYIRLKNLNVILWDEVPTMILRRICDILRFTLQREIFASNVEADLEGGEAEG